MKRKKEKMFFTIALVLLMSQPLTPPGSPKGKHAAALAAMKNPEHLKVGGNSRYKRTNATAKKSKAELKDLALLEAGMLLAGIEGETPENVVKAKAAVASAQKRYAEASKVAQNAMMLEWHSTLGTYLCQ